MLFRSITDARHHAVTEPAEDRAPDLVRMVERYADFHQVGFVAFFRGDADLLDAGTNPIKRLVLPS